MERLDICMYCGAQDELTDEHIIPYGIGGDMVLHQSSCKPCAAITSRDELTVLRGFMFEARLVGKMPSRRKKKQPKNLTRVLIREDGTEFTKDYLIAQGVATMHLPIFTPPGVIDGRGNPEGISVREIATVHLGMEVIRTDQGVHGYKFKADIAMGAFCRFLCKIAYGYHIREKGVFPFEESPALKILLGQEKQYDQWIGSMDFSYPESRALHVLQTFQLPTKDGKTIDIVNINLFRAWGVNSSYVVITRVSDSKS